MNTTTITGRSWKLTLSQEWIEVTSERPTPNERWRYTDNAGHEHYYNRGYPTLRLVVDAQHQCDGSEGLYNHDPHIAIDASHYECLLCGQGIEPAVDPPYTPKGIPGMTDGRLSGLRNDGSTIDMYLLPEEWESLQDVPDPDPLVQRILDNAPTERIYSVSIASR